MPIPVSVVIYQYMINILIDTLLLIKNIGILEKIIYMVITLIMLLAFKNACFSLKHYEYHKQTKFNICKSLLEMH